MMNGDLFEHLEKCKAIITKLNLSYVVLHLPFDYCALFQCSMGEKNKVQTLMFFIECIKFAEKNNVEIDILFHIGTTSEKAYIQGETFDFLHKLNTVVKGTKVGILLENETGNPAIFENNKEMFELWTDKGYGSEVKFCLDICHTQATEYLFQTEIVYPKETLDRVTNIHFSYTVDKLGYRNKTETHGRVHRTIEECQKDLFYLQKKGIDLSKVKIVTEINENDYENRPDMLQEIEFLKALSLN